jgi:hypothetical protein
MICTVLPLKPSLIIPLISFVSRPSVSSTTFTRSFPCVLSCLCQSRRSLALTCPDEEKGDQRADWKQKREGRIQMLIRNQRLARVASEFKITV